MNHVETGLSIKTETPERAVFDLTNVDVSLMNVIRHALYADVAVLAPNTVTFLQYDGPLEPELISHMIGQLPLRCIGADGTPQPPACQHAAEFSIDVQTSTAVPRLTWVKSTDVTCTSGVAAAAEVVHFRSDVERDAAMHDTGFFLCPLHAGQRLVATFTATVATGRDGTRWNAVHPTVRPYEGTPGAYEVGVQTTGAISPKQALVSALTAVLKRLMECREAFVPPRV